MQEGQEKSKHLSRDLYLNRYRAGLSWRKDEEEEEEEERKRRRRREGEEEEGDIHRASSNML